MQLSLYDKYLTYYPPKTQLLKWIGNKQKFAKEITSFFPTDYIRYFEPFLGSGAVLATVAPKMGFGSDNFQPLVDIWKTLKKNPTELIEWYESRRSLISNGNKEEVYEKIKESFNKNKNGADFLFLSRACYGGVIRFRQRDGFMSTPCGVHNPITVESFKKRVFEWYERTKGSEFECLDYKEAFAESKVGDLVYCDPPYTHSQAILYGAQEFRLDELIAEIDNAKTRGVKIALSIDGSKKSGKMLCEIKLPKNLFEREVFVRLGGSMLKRFQIAGDVLNNEDVSDRLLLTY